MSDVFSAMSNWMMQTLGLDVSNHQPGQADGGQASNVMQQMQLDAQKQQEERLKIMQDQQTKIFEVEQDVTVNKAQTADKAFNAMDGYIRN